MIIDAFLYAGEADMLELRLRTLNDVVDVFIAVEASVTHQGQPRLQALLPHRRQSSLRRRPHEETARWAPWAHKLGVWFTTDAPILWDRGGVGSRQFQLIERWHRDQMLDAARWAANGDGDPLVLLSDVDEIPNPAMFGGDMLGVLMDSQRWLVCEQRFHSTGLDLLHPQQPWFGTCVSRLKQCAPQAQRNDRALAHEQNRIIHDGGWHLSWFGTDEERQRKLDTFSHAELRGEFDPMVGRAERVHANGERLRHLSTSEMRLLSWPEPIKTGEFIAPDGWWS